MLLFRDDVSSGLKQTLFEALSDLQGHLKGVLGFHAGPNVSVEADLVQGYRDAFWFDFEDAAARDAYLVDEKHRAFGAQLVAHTVDGVVVVDMDV